MSASVARTDAPTGPRWNTFARLFFRDDETAVQFHVPPSDHINIHPRPALVAEPRDAIATAAGYFRGEWARTQVSMILSRDGMVVLMCCRSSARSGRRSSPGIRGARQPPTQLSLRRRKGEGGALQRVPTTPEFNRPSDERAVARLRRYGAAWPPGRAPAGRHRAVPCSPAQAHQRPAQCGERADQSPRILGLLSKRYFPRCCQNQSS